jgi:hypothetical protein
MGEAESGGHSVNGRPAKRARQDGVPRLASAAGCGAPQGLVQTFLSRERNYFAALPPLAVQSAMLISMTPLPLQPF